MLSRPHRRDDGVDLARADSIEVTDEFICRAYLGSFRLKGPFTRVLRAVELGLDT